MRTFKITGAAGCSSVAVGSCLKDLPALLGGQAPIIVTDAAVQDLWGQAFPPGPVITIGRGEGAKTLDTALAVYRQLAALEADRASVVLGIGGGIVCDVAGFCASTYLRGLRFGFVPTTLLAQVDASVGGKNGVNLDGYKNLVGVIQQPAFVLCDPRFIATLPEAEIQNGMAEAVKHGAIADPDLLAFLETLDVDGLSPAALERIVADSVRIKAAVVNEDEKEAGLRRILNFGHTLGHAVEKVAGLSHGRAVSIGMAFAASLSVTEGLLACGQAARLTAVLAGLGLPTALAPGWAPALAEALGKDKKREGASVHFVLLSDLGRALVQPMALDRLKDLVLAAAGAGTAEESR